MRLACFGLLAAVRCWRRENNATIDFFDAACAAKFGMWCPDGLRLCHMTLPPAGVPRGPLLLRHLQPTGARFYICATRWLLE